MKLSFKSARRFVCIVFFQLASMPLLQAQSVSLEYTVDLTNPANGQIGVRMDIRNFQDTTATFYMPAWAPGDYIVSDFGKWITDFEASDTDGQPLPVYRRSSNEWTVYLSSRLATIRYTLRDIPEDSVASLAPTLNEIKPHFVYANGPTVFGYLKGHKETTCHVNYRIPDQWNLWCALDSTGIHRFRAVDYDELIDCPFIAGDSKLRPYSFFVNNARYDMVVNSEWDIPMDSLMDYTRKAVDYQTNLFGETPFERYLFIFHFISRGQYYGAMEHRNSSVYFMQPPIHVRNLRKSLYPLIIAHEFFHCWNPKRFTFHQLKTFDYQDTVRLKHLWFIEGLTEYYAKLTMVRTGLWQPQDFLNEMSMLAYQRGLDNLEKLSLRAGVIGVAPVMYSQGALIGFVLDIYCREETDNRKSLDDIMIYLNHHYARKNKSYEEKDFLSILKDASEVNMKSLHRNYVRAKKLIPAKKYFKKAGLLYEEIYHPFYGWNFDVDENNQLTVMSVSDQSTATAIGLQAGDVVTHLQLRPVPADLDSIRTLLESLKKLKVKDTIEITIERNGSVKRLNGRIRPNLSAEVRIRENPEAKPGERSILDGILNRKK